MAVFVAQRTSTACCRGDISVRSPVTIGERIPTASSSSSWSQPSIHVAQMRSTVRSSSHRSRSSPRVVRCGGLDPVGELFAEPLGPEMFDRAGRRVTEHAPGVGNSGVGNSGVGTVTTSAAARASTWQLAPRHVAHHSSSCRRSRRATLSIRASHPSAALRNSPNRARESPSASSSACATAKVGVAGVVLTEV